MRAMRCRAAILLLLVSLAGCGFFREAVAPKPTAYTLMVKPWHRYGVLKADITDLLASVDAVYLSCDLQRSMLQYKREAGLITALEEQLEEERLSSMCGAYHQFLVAIYTKRSDWALLDSERPYFRVFLKTERGVRKPDLVKPLELSDDEISTFYPFVQPWMKVYLIRFGRAGLEGVRRLELEFASLTGRITLSWDLR